MAIDMNITDIIILAIAIYVFLHFHNKVKAERKVTEKKYNNKNRGEDIIVNEVDIQHSPVIHIIFQAEVEEEELVSELADLYLDGRTFYYNGKSLQTEEKQNNETFVRYEDVQWDKLKLIDNK